MEKEILACIEDKNIKFLHSGQISKYIFPMERVEAHQKKISHIIVRVFIVSISPDNKIFYLIQKRSKKKKEFPEFFTDSASGHVIYKTNLDLNDIKQNAKRELEEEFGIPPKSIKKIKFYDLKVESNNSTTEIAYTFLGLAQYNTVLKPNPAELEIQQSRFYSKNELINLIENEKYIDYSKRIWGKIAELDIIKYFGLNNDTKRKKRTKSEVALFIGRFQPLHHGHIYVFNYILKNYNLLKIGIGSSQLSQTKTDPFTSEERVQFIQTALKKRGVSPEKYKIYEIPDIFNAKKWVSHVVSIVGKFDLIFSNSEWVRQLFHNQGYNLGRKLIIFKKKYNGSNIRNLINKQNYNWKSLVPKEVINLMIEFNGIQRIKQLHLL
ncbi:MAG: nicotinamide-nucleotide adenylyltransferase [Candidatus Odinarchaeota archaeon]